VDAMLGFDQVAKFNYFPGWHQTFTAAHLVVNQARWDALSTGDQSLIEMACTAGVIRNLAKGEALQGAVIEGFQAKGVTPIRFDRTVLKSLQAVTESVLQVEAEKDPQFAEILASQRKFMRSYKKWKALAYLPRDFDEVPEE